tara:strand:+ start:5455 stop:6555 length:1101 start_codon:yes stop_codon:yes gene_type:complete
MLAAQRKPSASMAMAERVRQMRERGREVISFAMGDTHVSPAPRIVDGITRAMQSGQTHYSSARGLPELRHAICEHYYQAKYHEDQILVVPGVKQGIYYVLQSLAPKRVCVLEPAWLGYKATANLLNVPVVSVDQTQPGWIDRLRRETFDVLIVCTPNNPDGKVFEASETEQLVRICAAKEAWLISDEIYSVYDYSQKWHSLADYDYQRIVVCNGFSKSHALTGLRVGWIATRHRDLVEACFEAQQHIATCVSTPVQYGVLDMVRPDFAELRATVNQYEANRQLICDTFPRLAPYAPDGALYFFVPASLFGESDGTALAEKLLDEAGIAVVPGEAYGENFSEFIRMSFSVAEATLQTGLNQMKPFLK